MERESFEDSEVADFLNQHFVSIKVDREERPDIDQIYMSVCQALTGQGGWPLTIVATPDQKPFFAGTYFPKHTRFGRPGLMEVLRALADKWQTDRARLNEASEKIYNYLQDQHAERGVAHGPLSQMEALLDRAAHGFAEKFDEKYGGFGSAPKFPTPHNLIFLLRYGASHQSEDIIQMVEKTLAAMYQGGIYDHVGYGFARYSTDRAWLVPHFEKMLYDNALQVLAYLEAFQVTGKAMYRNVVRDVLAYVLRDMTSPDGAFYSAEDADSEGEEGKFYLWTLAEIEEVLGDADGLRYAEHYGITESGNFEGSNIPNLIGQALKSSAKSLSVDGAAGQQDAVEADVAGHQDAAEADASGHGMRALNEKLFTAREKRVHPYKDDKVLTAWNALMICAFACAGRVLGEPTYIDAAKHAAAFVINRLTREDGRLLSRYRDGEAAHLAYVDDYSFFIWALIELYEATFDPEYLALALRHQKAMNELFWDGAAGGYFIYGSDGEALITRPKEIYDGATPSGNSVAALNLLRLAKLTGDTELQDLASQQISAFASDVAGYPEGYTFFLAALQFAYAKGTEIVIAGRRGDPGVEEMLQAVQKAYLPYGIVLFHAKGGESQTLDELVPYIKDQKAVGGQPTAYICENFSCKAPLTDLQALRAALAETSPITR